MRIVTTSCVLSELNQLGDDFRQIFIAARRFPKEKCKHTGTIEASDCLRLIIGNKWLLQSILLLLGENNPDKFVLATQDSDFVAEMRRVPSVH